MLLLAGVATLTALIGVGTAWLVTAYRFPGRDTLSWMLALPLAFPTYIVAYVYVDMFDAFGPVQNVLLALTGWRPTRDLLVSEHPLAARRDLRLLARALPLCVPRRARDVPDAERVPVRGRAHARRDALHAGAPRRAAAGAARARGRPVARPDGSAERHRRLRISRRAHADALDLHHLAQPLEPARRRADRLRDAGRDRGAARARALRPARQALSFQRSPRAAAGADRADRMGRGRGVRGLRAAGRARLPVAGDRSRRRGGAAPLRSRSRARRAQHRSCSPRPRPSWRSSSASAP